MIIIIIIISIIIDIIIIIIMFVIMRRGLQVAYAPVCCRRVASAPHIVESVVYIYIYTYMYVYYG